MCVWGKRRKKNRESEREREWEKGTFLGFLVSLFGVTFMQMEKKKYEISLHSFGHAFKLVRIMYIYLYMYME